MDPAIEQQLLKAYRLIKSHETDAARATIRPILVRDPDNIDAWWLAAHSATSTADIRLALGQVLRINPSHQPAQTMLQRLNARQTAGDSASKSSRRHAPLRAGSTRWVWNIVLAIGLAGLTFGGLALASAFLGLPWFDDAVESVGDAFGLDIRGQIGDYGTVRGGAPGNPEDIPVTVFDSIGPGDIMIESLKPGEAHIWEFSAPAEQEVMALVQFTIAGDARHVAELRDSSGKLVSEGVGALDSGTVTLVDKIPRAGRYQLIIIGRPGGPRGTYNLAIELAAW